MKYIEWKENWTEDIVDLWNKELEKVFPMQQTLFKQNSLEDKNIDWSASLLALDHTDRVVGFIIVKRWQETIEIKMNPNVAWIQVLLVDSDFRKNGIGSTLLYKAEEKLQKTNMEKVWLGKDPWHYFPGIPSEWKDSQKWFEKRGYENHGKETDLICSYSDDLSVEFPTFKDVEFRLLKPNQQKAFLNFLHTSFPGRWEYEAIKYFEKGGLGREFVLLVKGGEIIGFCRINDIRSPIIGPNVYWSPLFNSDLGGIGPLGISQKERKNGYGITLVQAAIYFLRKRKIKHLIIDWTGLVAFYEKLGFQKWQEYETYSKRLIKLRDTVREK
ncbi:MULTISPECIES: GNAT family N-acetyltransferase [unclassified Bacillus (in: firmicutes)]|uniref:GNAT family N-acetyltransferase n=1 Tax=unclassified Bacillus (in: firmicutes) TaxID=185979 RepID=UPI0004E17758|nr:MULTISPECIES: GNAT family N-acetyltransferase [unclassified Bacillus (in: firmicutes)]